MCIKIKHTLFSLFAIIFIACNNSSNKNINPNSNPVEDSTVTNKKKTDKDNLDKKLLYITNQNAVSVFTKYFKKNTERTFKLSTNYGDIVFRIFEDTPIHSGNFLYLVKEKQYYDSTLFYRVSKDFIIQGGDADNDNIQSRRFAIGDYYLPSEFTSKHRHYRGAIGMSRNYGDNPDKVSTAYDFYIVLGKKMAPIQLQAIERDNGINYSKTEAEIYKTKGGAPHLDFQHTVFGEVISGMEVAEKISLLEADSREWPKENVKMSIKPLK